MTKTGGIYKFECRKCGDWFERFAWDGDDVKCDCGGASSRVVVSGKHFGMDYDQPVLSNSLGVNPDQVQEHRRMHPDIPILDDGRIVMRNYSERRRIMKYFGVVDKSKR